MPVVVIIIAYLWNKTFNCKFVQFNMCQGTYLLVLDTHRCFTDTIDNPHLSTARLLVLLSLREKREGSEGSITCSRPHCRVAGLGLEPRSLVSNPYSFHSVTNTWFHSGIVAQIARLLFQFLLIMSHVYSENCFNFVFYSLLGIFFISSSSVLTRVTLSNFTAPRIRQCIF